MTTYAQLKTRRAPLHSDFGEQLARKWFGGEIDKLPRYVRGANKGKLKGWLTWVTATRGGWHRDCGVVAPGTVMWKEINVDHKPVLGFGQFDAPSIPAREKEIAWAAKEFPEHDPESRRKRIHGLNYVGE